MASKTDSATKKTAAKKASTAEKKPAVKKTAATEKKAAPAKKTAASEKKPASTVTTTKKAADSAKSGTTKAASAKTAAAAKSVAPKSAAKGVAPKPAAAKASSAKNPEKPAAKPVSHAKKERLVLKSDGKSDIFSKVEGISPGAESADIAENAESTESVLNAEPENISAAPASYSAHEKKSSKAPLIVAVILLLAALGAIAFLGIKAFGASGSSPADFERRRANTLSLAQKYIDKGQYDKAMDLLNELLIGSPDDEEADALLDKAIRLKKENSPDAAGTSVVVQSPDAPYNISIDTDEITNALREQNERNQQVINELLEQQRRSQSAEAAEQAAARKAEAEQRKKEEAERREKEEALAKKNAALKKKIDDINQKIGAGQGGLRSGDIDGALANFSLAVQQLPLEEGEPEFSASKYSEIAGAIYDAAAEEKDAARKEKLDKAALDYVNKALAVNPNDPKSHYILGMNYMDSGDWAKAEKELSAAVQNDGNNYLYYYNLGRVQYKQKNYNGARSSFTSSIKYKADFADSYYYLGGTNRQLSLYKDALSAFRSARTVNPQHGNAFLWEARILKDNLKDSNGAISAYNSVLSIDPVNVPALSECGSEYANLGDYKKAEEYLRKAVSLLKPGEQDPITYYNLATALFNQNKLSEAEKYAKTAYDQKNSLKKNSEKSTVVYNYALIEDSLKNTDTAISLYKEVLALDPDNAKTKTNLGRMFMEMNDADTALTFFESAYKVEKSFELENNMGSAYLAKKDYDNAITFFKSALKRNPDDNTVRFNLAQAYSGSGDFDNAKATYTEIISRDAGNWDSYIEISKVFIAQNDMANAQSYLKILQQKTPTYRKAEVDSLLSASSAPAN